MLDKLSGDELKTVLKFIKYLNEMPEDQDIPLGPVILTKYKDFIFKVKEIDPIFILENPPSVLNHKGDTSCSD